MFRICLKLFPTWLTLARASLLKSILKSLKNNFISCQNKILFSYPCNWQVTGQWCVCVLKVRKTSFPPHPPPPLPQKEILLQFSGEIIKFPDLDISCRLSMTVMCVCACEYWHGASLHMHRHMWIMDSRLTEHLWHQWPDVGPGLCAGERCGSVQCHSWAGGCSSEERRAERYHCCPVQTWGWVLQLNTSVQLLWPTGVGVSTALTEYAMYMC